MPLVSASTTIPIEAWQEIAKLVKNGEYKSLSDFIRKATLDKLKGET